LLKIIKNPVTNHLPVGCKKYLASYNCQNIVKLKDLAKPEDDEPIVVVVGGISHGKVVIS
jgi:rRNA small subunit pseudouridine methyltransferase Nep1